MSQATVGPARTPVGRARRERLGDARLYLITDDETPAAELPRLIAGCVAAGVDMVQLRRKGVAPDDLYGLAMACREAAQAGGALFLVDDHVDLAQAVDADGVHLGQSDLDPALARSQVGPELLIGLSTHAVGQVARSADQPVDYISAGPVHATPTKPGRIAVGYGHVSAAALRSRVPVVAIGGLGPGTAGIAVGAGADIVGVVRAFCRAPDPGRVAKDLRAEIAAASPWVRIWVNGESRKSPQPSSLGHLLDLLEVGRAGVVVERNGEIVPGVELDQAAVEDGDQLEVVHLVGGGS
ncbi:MAG TPA: thiamine phosphate synthase [Candidatus Dormibacteraeota bacterium]